MKRRELPKHLFDVSVNEPLETRFIEGTLHILTYTSEVEELQSPFCRELASVLPRLFRWQLPTQACHKG